MSTEWPQGLAIADYDRDGDLDVVSGASNIRTRSPWTEHEVGFYENQLGGNWLRVAGLPAWTSVQVRAGELVQTQEVSGGYGHMSIQNDVPLHFGLGGGCVVDEVTATTADGRTGTWGPVAGNTTLTLSL